MDKVSDNADFKSEHPQVYRRLFGDSCPHSRAATEPRRTNFVTVVSEVRVMATTRSQAARDAAPETTMERESVASGALTDDIIWLCYNRLSLSHIRSKKGVRERTTRKKRRQDNEIK